ncbi:KAP family P-loop NTPase fold protein [Prevotellamassilia timonensis]|uniref:KAP family P-loop NTPase fold protein n=1 Tax=Prevotellamassilia timonensis TaxID=1852370 RepID=UPI003A9024F2
MNKTCINKLYYLLLATLFLSGLYALRSDIETYISKMWVGELFDYVYKACITNDLFNFLFTLTLASLFFIIGKKVFQSNGSVLGCIGCIFAILYLSKNTFWIFPKVFLIDIDYGAFLIISLMAVLIIDVIAIARKLLNAENANISNVDDRKGYCMDGVYSEPRQIGWDNYVSDLLALMPHYRLMKESLAIGISGNWGSGKTSFLKSMQKQMNADYRVVTFNPWTCTDKEQIISQFFALMREQTENNEESLHEAIQKYQDIVLDADIHPAITFLAKILPLSKKEETLESLKDKIEEAITIDGSKPFAIFIDDLDRLEGNELFEVLRLIRITANFRNVVFVVAYDRDYICNVLNESKYIKRAEEYIQKIFHLEVSLPKFEDDTLLDVFMEEVVRIASLNERQATRLRQLVMQLLNIDGLSFTDFVPNFRQARRFANVFALNLKSILAHTKDFVVKDFIGVELLHFAYPEIHRTLMYKPMILLKLNKGGFSKSKLLVYEGKDNTPSDKLLRKLFYSNNNETQLTSREVRSQLSYANYFCYRLPNNSIGATEFEMLMIADDLDVVRDGVNVWMRRKDSFDSLYEHFRSYYMHGYKDIKVIRNYICALLEFIPQLSDKGIEQIISDRYWIRGGVDVDELRKQLISLFEYSISKGKFLEKINHLLASFYNAYPDDYEPDDIALDLFKRNQLEMLAGKSLVKYTEINGKPSPSEISHKGTPFNKFLKSGCYVQNYYREGDEYVGIDTNLMCDELIIQYQNTESDYATFCDFIQPYLIKTDDPAEEEYEAKSIATDICSIFDSYTFFEKFVHGAFTPTEEIEKKLKYIRSIMHGYC